VDQRKRKNPTAKTRLEVFKRDRYTCQICGRSPAITPGLELEVDHREPFSKGGADSLHNYQTLMQRIAALRQRKEVIVGRFDGQTRMVIPRRLTASLAAVTALAVPLMATSPATAATATADAGSTPVSNSPLGYPRCPDNYVGPTNPATGCPPSVMIYGPPPAAATEPTTR
jgi:hypothetical protein